MKLALSTLDAIPEWLYPGSFADIDTPESDCIDWPDSKTDAIQALWEAADKPGELALSRIGVDPCGIPHDAPSFVFALTPEFTQYLVEVPIHERWKLAEKWGRLIRGRQPNAELAQRLKAQLKELCETLQKADPKQFLIILPSSETLSN